MPARARSRVGRRHETGSAIVYVMLTVGVLSVVAGSLLLTNVSRYQTAFQSASWQEAIVGAEAGVDLAMNELRKRVVTGPAIAFQGPWTTTSPQTGKTYANFGHVFSATNNQAYQIASHGGEGNTAMQLRVLVDVPGCDSGNNFAQPNDNSFISQLDNPKLRDADGVDRSRWLFRIKSLGITGLTGPPRPNLNKYDNRLRRFSFFNDWRTGRTVTAPQTARLVEAVVRPETGFRNALMADSTIDLSNVDVLIDSYDSSKGVYSATNTGNQGNIATNGQLINANHATVNGNAMTNNGTVNNAQNVTGQQSSTFYQELPAITTASMNPAWAAVPDGGTVTTSQTYNASADMNNPTLVRLDGINLPVGGNIISINPATTATGSGGTGTATTQPSYIKIFVNGDITTYAASFINVDPNVTAVFYVGGNINLQGVGIINQSYLANHLVINGIQPTANADGTYPARSIAVTTSEDFEGIIYAPNHDLSLALTAAVPSSGVYQGSNSNLALIANIQSQIFSTNQDLIGNQIAYAQDSSKPGEGSARKAAQDLTQIAADQAKLNQLNQELLVFQGAAGPTSSTDDHAQGYNGIYGGFVAKTIKVANKTHVHYDETLRTAGPVNHYEIVNWFEDNLSHDATGGAELFWW